MPRNLEKTKASADISAGGGASRGTTPFFAYTEIRVIKKPIFTEDRGECSRYHPILYSVVPYP